MNNKSSRTHDVLCLGCPGEGYMKKLLPHLGRLGLTALLVSGDIDKAVEELKQQEFRAIVTEITLGTGKYYPTNPLITGKRLIEDIRAGVIGGMRITTDCPIVILTSHLDTHLLRQVGEQIDRDNVFTKPTSFDIIAKRVAEAIGSK